MIGKLRLRHRLLLGYLAPLVLLLAAMVIVFINLEKATDASSSLETLQLEMDTANDLAYSLTKMQRAARGYLLVQNPTSRQRFYDSEKAFRAESDRLTSLAKAPQQQENLRQMLNLGRELGRDLNQYLILADSNQLPEALELFRSMGVQRAEEIESLWESFKQRLTMMVKERREIYDTAIQIVTLSIIYGMLSATTLAIAIAIWLATIVSRNITATAVQLSAAANEIAATIEQHERTASQQAAAANQTSATINELSASSRNSATQAANSAAMAEKAGTASIEGDEATRQTVAAMGGLRDRINVMAEHILHLGEQTGQIGNIATVLKDLAGQINMLALNAAVEAARAGEHGKGFAVVANEIRKLVDESRKSAEQTAQLVREIQNATNSSIIMTEEGNRTVSEVTQLVQKVAELFNNLANLAGSANENAQQVMLNAKQQSAAFDQIVEATNSIASGAKETATGISQTKLGVQSLNEAAENLKAMV